MFWLTFFIAQLTLALLLSGQQLRRRLLRIQASLETLGERGGLR